MPQPTRSEVHVNTPLTNISIAYLQDQSDFIAGRVFPNIPVVKASDTYYIYPKDQWHRSDAQRRSPGTESVGTGYGLTTDTYSIGDPLALHHDVPDPIRNNADAPLNLDRDATMLVTAQMLLTRELEWATKYFGTGIWTGAADLTPSSKWDVTSTPIGDVRARILAIKIKTGKRPNTFIIAEDGWNAIQDNSDFLDRIAVTQRKIVTTELLAAVLGIDRVLVAGAIKNTAPEGATVAMASAFSDGALLCYSAPTPGIMVPSAGYTFSLKSLFGAGNDGLRIKRFRMEPIASDRVEGEMAYDQKLVATDLGAFFTSILT